MKMRMMVVVLEDEAEMMVMAVMSTCCALTM